MTRAWVAGLVGLVFLPSMAFGFDHAGDATMAATLGGVQYWADEDSRDGASPRFGFGGYVEYASSARWSIRLDSSVGWSSYPEDKSPTEIGVPHPVKIVSPTVFSFIRRFNPDAENNWYAGGGFGLYFWRYKISGKAQRDPVTFEKIQSGKIMAFDPGLHALVGYEHPLNDRVSLHGESALHYIFSANDTDRPDKAAGSGFEDYPVFNGNDGLITLRMGVRVYFDLTRFEEPEEEY